MSAYEPLSAENRAALGKLIGDAVRPAGPDFLLRLGRTVKDCRTHDHETGEDLFCGNLYGWMGERMALVMRRLLDAEAGLERRPTHAAVLQEAAEVAVRAARACGDTEAGQYAASVAAGVGKELRRMANAAGKGPLAGGESTREDTETCGRCRRPFDPADTRFDGRARYRDTPFCGGCVDQCHESTDPFHRCPVCTEGGGDR